MGGGSSTGVPVVEAGGATIPTLGLGTWQNTGASCTSSVRDALDLGYRHIDTAQGYGNEAAVGKGIAAADVDRSDVFVTTKIQRSNLRREDVLESVHESLDRLGVETIDLLLIHWPNPRVPVEETLTAMAELQDDGLVAHLGVSNFSPSLLRAAMDAIDRPLVTDQVLYHPFADQTDLLALCRESDITLTAYSPLARGAVAGNELLSRIGTRYEKSAAQVALRWLLQQDGVVVIPKATGRDHIAENAAVFDFSLTSEEMDAIFDLSPGLTQRLLNHLPVFNARIPLP